MPSNDFQTIVHYLINVSGAGLWIKFVCVKTVKKSTNSGSGNQSLGLVASQATLSTATRWCLTPKSQGFHHHLAVWR